jgi:8-oxo-dGTP diphosphatase
MTGRVQQIREVVEQLRRGEPFGAPREAACARVGAYLDAAAHAVQTGWPRGLGGYLDKVEQAAAGADVDGVSLYGEGLYLQLVASGAIAPVTTGVGALIVRDGRLLLGLRTGAHGAGTWCLAGGHLDPGETADQATIREVREETRMRARVTGPPLPEIVMWSTEKLRLYRDLITPCDTDGDPVRVEPDRCLEWRWSDPADPPEPLFFPLAEARRRGFDLAAACATR